LWKDVTQKILTCQEKFFSVYFNSKITERGFEVEKDVVIASPARLPIGRFGGALKEVSDWDLVE